MLAALALVFAVVWVMALAVLEAASVAVHVVLVLAVLSMIAHLVWSVRSPAEREKLL